MSNEKYYIALCRRLIEEKLDWGESQYWQNQMFDDLSLLISEETGVNLSNSTLKRIWGKVKYDGSPNLTTLNALAQFIGYPNWLHFTQRCNTSNKAVQSEPARQSRPIQFRYSKSVLAAGFGVLLVVAGLLWAFQKEPKRLSFKNIYFTSTPVTTGLPNTVVFNYNAAESNADSVFIQQSWDPARRYKVDKYGHEYTSTYYTPGYFRAKLILNDSIVKQHDLFIESDGWMATIGYEPIPTYIEKQKFIKNNIMGIDMKDIPNAEDFKKQKLWMTFHKVSEKMMVPSENFSMETELRSTYAEEEGICQFTEILLLGSEGVIIIPLSIKGCSGELALRVGENLLDGRTNDLSAFGVDFEQFVNVKCAVKNKIIKILVNEQLAYEGVYSSSIGKIVGTRLRFRGTGEVKKFEMVENN